MKKVLTVFGTRPEGIKLAPLLLELKKQSRIRSEVCVTGQHREMLDPVLCDFAITPDYTLSLMREKQSLSELFSRLISGCDDIYTKSTPDLVLVHGDTATAFAAGLAAFYRKIPVWHVEAGLRTHNMDSPFPEEYHRQSISLFASFHFAPTERARQNLLEEGKDSASVLVTGNTAIDTLRLTYRPAFTHPALLWATGFRFILLTAHRRENLGRPLRNICNAILRVCRLHPEIRILYPLHRNPEVRETATKLLSSSPSVLLSEPLDVIDCHNLLARCDLVLTDSGGLQEEAPFFGKPVLVLRDTTERQEGIEAGTLRLVGTDEDSIVQNLCDLLEHDSLYRAMANAVNPYGDGYASVRIAKKIADDL